MEQIAPFSKADILACAVPVSQKKTIWYDHVNRCYVSFSNPKKFRKYLKQHSLGHCHRTGKQLFYLPKQTPELIAQWEASQQN